MEPQGSGTFAWDDGSPYTLDGNIGSHDTNKSCFILNAEGFIYQKHPTFFKYHVVCQGDFRITGN